MSINRSNIYTVLFEAGSAGTFLIWFVSQHDDFFKLLGFYSDQYQESSEDPVHTIENSVRHMVLNISSFELNNKPLDDYLDTRFKNATSNNKIIFKILPHIWNVDVKECRNLSFPNINVIMIVVENWDWVSYRLEFIKQKSGVINQSRIEQMRREYDSIQEYFKTNGINYCEISIDKILNLDITEYNKLLGFIGSKAIPNWQDLILDFKKNVGLREL